MSKTQHGLTLIEILVVVGILGLILAMTTGVNVDLFRGDLFRSEQSTVISLLEKARSRSMSNMYDTTHGVCYSSGNYILFRGSTCSPSASTSEKFPANVEISTASNFASAFPTIVFNRLAGTTTSGSLITIAITDGVKSANIEINNEGTISW